MAFTSSEWTINYVAKTVTNDDSGTGDNVPSEKGDDTHVGPVIEFFQWLAGVFAGSTQMDDDYAFVSDTPTVFRWVNDWAFGHADDFKYLTGGSVESSDADDFWSNVYTIGTQEEGTLIYMIQNETEVSPWWISGNIDILVKVKNSGTWIQSEDTAGDQQNGGIWLFAREFGDFYDHNYSSIAGGRTPIGINTSEDKNNASGELYLSVTSATGFTVDKFVVGGTSGAVGKIQKISTNDIYLNAVRGGPFVISETLTEYSDREAQTATGQSTTNDGATAFTNVVAGWDSDFTETFGDINRDLSNGDGLQPYKVEVDGTGRSMANFYEWLKFICRYASGETVNSDDGQEYRSCVHGTYGEVKVAPFGTLAGTTFYGARGVWVTDYLASDFVLIDADGDSQSPPDYQKVIASHASLSGCQVFVAEIAAGDVIKDQYTISSTTASTITVVAASIDINKVPEAGTLRKADTVYTYTSFAGKVFSGVSPDASSETGDIYVPLLDLLADAVSEQSGNIIYDSDFNIRTVVRKYGFKPYTQDTTFGSAGRAFTPILADDPQAT